MFIYIIIMYDLLYMYVMCMKTPLDTYKNH